MFIPDPDFFSARIPYPETVSIDKKYLILDPGSDPQHWNPNIAE